jgi:hypothetical protein
MAGEVIITIALVSFAVYVFYRNFRKKSSGKCDCCSGDKPRRKFSK